METAELMQINAESKQVRRPQSNMKRPTGDVSPGIEVIPKRKHRSSMVDRPLDQEEIEATSSLLLLRQSLSAVPKAEEVPDVDTEQRRLTPNTLTSGSGGDIANVDTPPNSQELIWNEEEYEINEYVNGEDDEEEEIEVTDRFSEEEVRANSRRARVGRRAPGKSKGKLALCGPKPSRHNINYRQLNEKKTAIEHSSGVPLVCKRKLVKNISDAFERKKKASAYRTLVALATDAVQTIKKDPSLLTRDRGMRMLMGYVGPFMTHYSGVDLMEECFGESSQMEKLAEKLPLENTEIGDTESGEGIEPTANTEHDYTPNRSPAHDVIFR